MVHHCCDLLRQRLDGARTPSGLVVGCGNGDEVVYVRRVFNSRQVVGVDVEEAFSPTVRVEGCTARGDALCLPFADGSFNLTAAFHSLEHVTDPGLALDEIHRVLRPCG